MKTPLPSTAQMAQIRQVNKDFLSLVEQLSIDHPEMSLYLSAGFSMKRPLTKGSPIAKTESDVVVLIPRLILSNAAALKSAQESGSLPAHMMTVYTTEANKASDLSLSKIATNKATHVYPVDLFTSVDQKITHSIKSLSFATTTLAKELFATTHCGSVLTGIPLKVGNVLADLAPHEISQLCNSPFPTFAAWAGLTETPETVLLMVSRLLQAKP